MDLAASHLRVKLSNEDRLTHVQRFPDHATLDAYTARTGLKVVEIETIEPEPAPVEPAPRTQAEVRASVLATMNASIARLEACAAGPEGADTILSWGNGLAVKMHEGKALAVSIDKADGFRAAKAEFAFPVVMNGHRETAVPRMRKVEALAHAADLRETIADFEGEDDDRHDVTRNGATA